MRFSVILLVMVVAFGCARRKASVSTGFAPVEPGITAPANTSQPAQKLLVTPENTLVGKVAKVNATGRFVILNFPIGRLPAMEQVLPVYRQGLKVGEVKVTGPQLDDNIVADILTGDAAVGDEVRQK